MSYYHDEPAPYGFIGVATTLPGKTRSQSKPIGFVWPKTDKKHRPTKTKGKR